ncbi:cytidine deaminase [Drosophila guanche]|uniref:Cytidine deaminase n=1 Tax=Drosophila guanche TaxID=7266 RepID=A0A3B0JHK9_DROGU|nr:cytidine deaminase [Drosophila guanche]XP_034125105.1 cytidine deaminase [Drosophila guanche]SPP79782.1 blast:Cytidine deaminase [Drosophila guanche]
MSHLMKNFARPEKAEEVVTYGSLDPAVQELLLAASAVRQRAYAPYSGFKVGAAFRSTLTKQIFTGCNVENAAFTPCSCAERTALTKAVSEGATEFSMGAVLAYEPDVFTTPCGVCRQFIREFATSDIPIYIAQAIDERIANKVEPLRSDDPVLCTSIFNLLPSSFRTYRK